MMRVGMDDMVQAQIEEVSKLLLGLWELSILLESTPESRTSRLVEVVIEESELLLAEMVAIAYLQRNGSPARASGT
ncbi:hypothetical protein [Gellertiella hungarica]